MRKGSAHRRLPQVAAATAVVMTVVTGCSDYGEETIDGYVYCVDKDTGEIVDEDYCDSSGSTVLAYWFWTTTDRHPHGYRVPSKYHKSFVNPRDPNARAKAGIPKTGTVRSGQKISSGGFGNGAKVSPGKGGGGGFFGGGKGGSGGG